MCACKAVSLIKSCVQYMVTRRSAVVPIPVHFIHSRLPVKRWRLLQIFSDGSAICWFDKQRRWKEVQGHCGGLCRLVFQQPSAPNVLKTKKVVDLGHHLKKSITPSSCPAGDLLKHLHPQIHSNKVQDWGPSVSQSVTRSVSMYFMKSCYHNITSWCITQPLDSALSCSLLKHRILYILF